MKRPFYIFLCLICLSLTVYSQDYYWYGNKKVFLIPATQHFVLVNKTDNVNRIMTNWHTANKFVSTLKEPLLYGVIDNEILAKIDGSSIKRQNLFDPSLEGRPDEVDDTSMEDQLKERYPYLYEYRRGPRPALNDLRPEVLIYNPNEERKP